jgi:hypothetical protein
MSSPTDIELNAIGVLKRRAIASTTGARIRASMAREFGPERVHAIVREVVVGIARRQGAALAEACGGKTLNDLHGTLDRWTADDALRLEVLDQSDERLSFDVTRCRYAEMYRELGIPELGAILSCGRDAALVEGFNPGVQLTRTQTILQGAPCCDFRYQSGRVSPPGVGPDA